MESARIARCSYRSLTVVIALSENSKYLDICNEICLRFKELKVGSFDLTYSLPDHPNCLLQSDMDFRMMLMCLTMLKSSFVDILVKDLVSSNNDNGDQKCEESDHTASNHAMSNREVSNRTAPLSCTLESRSAIDENDHFGDSRLDGGNAYLSQDWKEYISHDGQRFEGGVTEFRNKLCKYAAHMRFRIAYVKNEKERVLAECFKKISDGCNWRIYASLCRGNGFFYIRSLNNVHTCTPVVDEQKSKMMSSKVVSSVLVDQIREKPTIKPADIVKDFKQKYGLDISYHSAWHGKELAKSEVHGNESLSYNQLVQYRDALMSTNPGSHCVLECNPTTSRFQRLFICYGACIEGFRWCRPLLFIDATYFKSKYKGQLIGATGRDGNQGFFPFAFAIVDSENEENWRWFFENLAKVLTPQELYALPICQMVDGFRIKLMGLMSQRSCEAKECCSILCPVMEKTLNEMSIVGRHWNAIRSSASVFEVHAEGSFMVDLDKHFCSCHEWQIKGFPCAHAVAAVQKNSGCIYDYIDDYFKLNYFRSSYATLISPIPDIKDAVHGCSEDIVILPPLIRQPGTKKMKSAGEFSRAVTCSRCGAVGRHNKKTCTANM